MNLIDLLPGSRGARTKGELASIISRFHHTQDKSNEVDKLMSPSKAHEHVTKNDPPRVQPLREPFHRHRNPLNRKSSPFLKCEESLHILKSWKLDPKLCFNQQINRINSPLLNIFL